MDDVAIKVGKRFGWLLTLAIATASSACYVEGTAGGSVPPPAAEGEVVVESPPPAPAPVVEAPPPAPSPDVVWIGGYHRWDGRAYVWVPGRYERRRERGRFVAGHWERRGRGHVWIEGRWE